MIEEHCCSIPTSFKLFIQGFNERELNSSNMVILFSQFWKKIELAYS